MPLKNWFAGANNFRCPLCGATGTTHTSGYTRYTDLRQKLGGVPEWLKAHGTDVGIPDIPAEVRKVVGNPDMPGLDAGDDAEHRRCAGCRSLLPPQFWREGPASPLAMTVAGAAGLHRLTKTEHPQSRGRSATTAWSRSSYIEVSSTHTRRRKGERHGGRQHRTARSTRLHAD